MQEIYCKGTIGSANNVTPNSYSSCHINEDKELKPFLGSSTQNVLTGMAAAI